MGLLSRLDKLICSYLLRYEHQRLLMRGNPKEQVLPPYVLKRRIKFITNGVVVFDSDDYKETGIPYGVQCSIKEYGYPNCIKPNNKTPLIYNITSNVNINNKVTP